MAEQVRVGADSSVELTIRVLVGSLLPLPGVVPWRVSLDVQHETVIDCKKLFKQIQCPVWTFEDRDNAYDTDVETSLRIFLTGEVDGSNAVGNDQQLFFRPPTHLDGTLTVELGGHHDR